jgi:hypothetical protein
MIPPLLLKKILGAFMLIMLIPMLRSLIQRHQKLKEKNDDKTFLDFRIIQTQADYPEFHFPLEIKLSYNDGSSEIKRIEINSVKQELHIEIQEDLSEVLIDPDYHLLAVFKHTQ